MVVVIVSHQFGSADNILLSVVMKGGPLVKSDRFAVPLKISKKKKLYPPV